MVEIRHLIYFAKVAELESLTHAAEALNVTQPALGMQMRKLEEYLDVALIERHSRGVRLTEAGHALHKHAIRIIEGFEEAKAEVRRYGKDAVGTVRIGVTPSMGRVVVPTLLQECADLHPTLNLQLTQGFTDQLELAIQDKHLDFAVTHRPFETETLESLPLYVETFLAIGSPELLEKLANPISLADFSELPLALDGRSLHIRKKLDNALSELGLAFRDVQDIDAINLRRELVIQGRRATLATHALFQDEIAAGTVIARPIEMEGLTPELSLTTRRVEQMTPAEMAIRKLLISIIDKVIEREEIGWTMPRS